MRTIDSFLLYKLAKVHKTDYSNASRTQLFDLQKLKWSERLCEEFGVSINSLAQVCMSDSVFGESDFGGVFDDEVCICSVMGDSHAALFAQGCVNAGMAKATYGTGSSVMMNTAQNIVPSQRLATSIAWGKSNKVSYVLEGNVNYTGGIFTWLCEDMQLMSSAKQAAELSCSVKDNDGVYLVPAFSGLGAPYWNADAKALICGMTRSTAKAHIVRAAEESIAYQINDIAQEINALGTTLSEIKADGGPTKDSFLMQFQADILGIPVDASSLAELSAAGVAYMAGFACNLYNDEILSKARGAKQYLPSMEDKQRDELYSGWKNAVEKALT